MVKGSIGVVKIQTEREVLEYTWFETRVGPVVVQGKGTKGADFFQVYSSLAEMREWFSSRKNSKVLSFREAVGDVDRFLDILFS